MKIDIMRATTGDCIELVRAELASHYAYKAAFEDPVLPALRVATGDILKTAIANAAGVFQLIATEHSFIANTVLRAIDEGRHSDCTALDGVLPIGDRMGFFGELSKEQFADVLTFIMRQNGLFAAGFAELFNRLKGLGENASPDAVVNEWAAYTRVHLAETEDKLLSAVPLASALSPSEKRPVEQLMKEFERRLDELGFYDRKRNRNLH